MLFFVIVLNTCLKLNINTKPEKMKKVILSTVLCAVLSLSFTSCRDSKKAESAKEAMHESADKAGEAIEDAADATGEALEDAADATENAVENAVDATGEALENAADATEDAIKETSDKVKKEANKIGDDK